jgi:hypothetical protein
MSLVPLMTCVEDFRRLAVVGSRWRSTWLRATCTVIRAASGPYEVPIIRGIRDDGTTISRARLDLTRPDYLAFTGDTVHILSATGQKPDGRHAWRYLGQARGPIAQPPADPDQVRACRVEQLQPGDIVYGPARRYDPRSAGYTVDAVDLCASPATVHTREDWPLRHGRWQQVAILPAGDPGGRCTPLPAPRPPVGPARVFLGVNTVAWLGRPELAGVPRCVSRNRLASYRGRRVPRSRGPLLLDSGGFTELKQHGRWRITAAEYVAEVRRLVAQLGADQVVGIAQQDWMCEDVVINGGVTKDGTFVGTRSTLDPAGRLSLEEMVYLHQRLTVDNLVQLRTLAPDLPIFPVLQGRTLGDYIRHTGMFTTAGVSFLDEPLVGLGSVCRRQGTHEVADIVRALVSHGFPLHGFGVGVQGLSLYGQSIVSTDSDAWSYAGRRAGRCPHGMVVWEANCPHRARTWWQAAQARTNPAAVRALTLPPLHRPAEQLTLFP